MGKLSDRRIMAFPLPSEIERESPLWPEDSLRLVVNGKSFPAWIVFFDSEKGHMLNNVVGNI